MNFINKINILEFFNMANDKGVDVNLVISGILEIQDTAIHILSGISEKLISADLRTNYNEWKDNDYVFTVNPNTRETKTNYMIVGSNEFSLNRDRRCKA